MDYLEIERLVASYGHALDNGYGTTDNGEAYAGLYTADATFGNPPGTASWPRWGANSRRATHYVRHYLTNHVIEPFAGQAIGKQYLVVFDVPEPSSGPRASQARSSSAGTTRTSISGHPTAGGSARAGCSARTRARRRRTRKPR